MPLGDTINLLIYSTAISIIGKGLHHLLFLLAIGFLTVMLASVWAIMKLVFRA